jgi:hypothetical protein
MRRLLQLLLLTAISATLAACACGNCGPTEDGDNPAADGGSGSAKPPKAPPKKLDLASWNDAEMKKRIGEAGWDAGKCTVDGPLTTCATKRGIVAADVILARFDDPTDATVHAKARQKKTGAIVRDGTNVLSVTVDPLAASEALRLQIGGDGTQEDMSEWGSRSLLVKIKGAGFKPEGACKKTHEPGVSTWTCQVSHVGLEGTVKLELVPGAPHTSDNGKKIPGKAVLDQGDAVLIVELEQGNAGADLLDELTVP